MDPKGKSPHQLKVEQFMLLAGQDVPKAPILPDKKVRQLRALLILEEALETIEALGFSVSCGCLNRFAHNGLKISNTELTSVYEPDLVKIVDGCCDTIVVTTGTLSACGVSDLAIQHEVDLSNLRKFGPGSFLNPVGKWIKPPDFRPPDIQSLLNEQSNIK